MIVLALALVFGIAAGLLIVAMILGVRVVRSERGRASLLPMAAAVARSASATRKARRRPRPDQGKQSKA